MKNNLYSNHASLLAICQTDNDFNLFKQILTNYINSNDDISLRRLLRHLIQSPSEFKREIIEYFQENHPLIYDEKLLDLFFDKRSKYSSYNDLLVVQYRGYNRQEQNDIINIFPNIISYFDKDVILSYFKDDIYCLHAVHNIELFLKLDEINCFTKEHYLFAHENLKEFLLSSEKDIIYQDISSFIPECFTEKTPLLLKDLYTISKQSMEEILANNKQKQKVIFENILMKNKNGLLVDGSRTSSISFLKKYPRWQDEILAGKSLPEIMLWNNIACLKNFIPFEKLKEDKESMTALFKNNKFLNIIENSPEKIKLMTMSVYDELNYSDIKSINSAVDTLYDKNVLYKIVNENIGTWFKLDFSKYNHRFESDKELIIDIFSNLTKESKKYLISQKDDSFIRSMLYGLKENNLLYEVGNCFTPEEKGLLISMENFNKYTEFFYGFSNDEFRENNKNYLLKSFEKESLALSLKKEFTKGMVL